VGVLALFSIPDKINAALSSNVHNGYEAERREMISKLSDANTCLSARIYFDGMHTLNSSCDLELTGLAEFSRRFAPYMAITPYSGAWNLEEYSSRVEEAAKQIDGSLNHQSLRRVEARTGLSLAKIGYYICGLEWYIRMAPPENVGKMSPARVKTYQDAWLSWLSATKTKSLDLPFESTEFEVKDDPECASFIDLLD
jgi:hypothetical protein